jgi:hypothetical protein
MAPWTSVLLARFREERFEVKLEDDRGPLSASQIDLRSPDLREAALANPQRCAKSEGMLLVRWGLLKEMKEG